MNPNLEEKGRELLRRDNIGKGEQNESPSPHGREEMDSWQRPRSESTDCGGAAVRLGCGTGKQLGGKLDRQVGPAL